MNHAKKLDLFDSESVNHLAKESPWNYRVLIVEDEIEIANAYRDILSTQDEKVIPMNRSSRSAKTEATSSTAVTSDPGAFPNRSRIPPPVDLTIVHTAEQALAAIKESVNSKRPFAMGFFDVRLGGEIDGVEVVKRAFAIDSSLYAVFVTAYHDRSIKAINDLLGENRMDQWDYLNKPFTKGEIIQKTRNLIALWNLKNERSKRDRDMAQMHEFLLNSERMNSVAAIARGVNHEFGNILLQIIGKAELGINKTEEGMRQALTHVLDAAQRASDILNRFKDLSDSSHRILKKQKINISDLLRGTVDLMEHQLKTGGVKVVYKKLDSVDVVADATSLMQVFVNLFINAIHAVGDNGEVNVSITKQSDGVEILIKDNGPGIPENLLDKVMQPLFTTKGEQGTGLGLAISREIIEVEHMGSFRLSNGSDGGLLVRIVLPFQG